MAALRSLSFCLLAVGLLLPPAAAYTGQTITAEAGRDVALPCGDGKETQILVVEWIRPDLDPDYVLFYRDGRCESDHQHPSFRNRVDLQDRRMKDGNVSLILKNVKIKDTGTYQCRVIQGGSDQELICTIHLEVPPPTVQRITAEAGQDSVTLPCKTGKETQIRAVEWFRPDLDPDGVLFYRDGHFEAFQQNPSFRNRVDLQDRQMKDGNASLILKHVTIKDTGRYYCRVIQGAVAQEIKLMSPIHLEVSSPPGTPEGGRYVLLIVGLLVSVLLFLMFLLVFFLICRKKTSRRKLFSRQPLAKATELELYLESPLSHYQLKQRNQILLSPLFRYPPEQQNQILECKLPAEPEPEPESPAEPEPEPELVL